MCDVRMYFIKLECITVLHILTSFTSFFFDAVILHIEGEHCVGIVDKMSLATILIENITLHGWQIFNILTDSLRSFSCRMRWPIEMSLRIILAKVYLGKWLLSIYEIHIIL